MTMQKYKNIEYEQKKITIFMWIRKSLCLSSLTGEVVIPNVVRYLIFNFQLLRYNYLRFLITFAEIFLRYEF